MTALSFLAFAGIVVIVSTIAVMLMLFSMGAMHQHLKNKGESFGSSDQLDRIERKLDATITANHRNNVRKH